MKQAFILSFFLLSSALLAFAACDDSGATGSPDGDQGQFCTENEDCDPGFICFEAACLYVGDNGDDDGEGSSGGDLDIPDSIDPITQVCPQVGFSTSEVNFGAVVAGHSRTDILYIKNASTNGELLNVHEVYYDTSQTNEFSWSWYVEDDPATEDVDESEQEILLPYSLEPGASLAVTIHYLPSDGYADTAWLHIATDDCLNPISEVKLVSEFKGTREVCVEPEILEWEGAVFGMINEEKTIKICNCGDPTGNKLLTIEDIGFREPNTNFLPGSGFISSFSPVFLSPRQANHSNDHEACHEVSVEFAPTPPDDATNYMNMNIEFSNMLQVINDSEVTIQQSKEVPLYGVARGGALISYPFPIDFGTKECGGIYNVPVTFINGTQYYLEIDDIEIMARNADDDCSPFNLDPASVGTMLGMQLEPYGNTGATYLTTQFNPTDPDYCEPERYNCWVRVTTHNVSDETGEAIQASFPLRARSKTPNEPPICRISTQPHGAPIITDIPDMQQDTYAVFYGEISTDEDSNHQMTDFRWEWVEKPEDSQAYFRPMNAEYHNVGITFDEPGDYEFCLTVRDNENADCVPRCIKVHVNGEQGLRVRMDFESATNMFLSSNHVDLDLCLMSPSGYTCCDDNMNMNHTCSFPNAEGTVLFSKWHNPTDGVRAAYEELRLNNPVNGDYEIHAVLVDDCDDWVDIFVIPFCGSHTDADYRLTISDSNVGGGAELFPDVEKSGNLDSVGETDQYIITRRNGVWTALYGL